MIIHPQKASNARENTASSGKLVDALLTTIEHLKSEVAFLREEVKVRDAQLSSVLIGHAMPTCFNAETPHPQHSWLPDKEGNDYDDHAGSIASISDKSAAATETPAPPRSWSTEPEQIVLSDRFTVLPVKEGGDSDDADDASIATTSRQSETANDANAHAHTYANVTTSTRQKCQKCHKPLADIEASPTPADETMRKIAELDARMHARNRQQGIPPRKSSPPRRPLVAVIGDSILKRMSSFEIRKRTRTAPTFVRPFIGATIAEMIEYIKPVLSKHPDVVILHIGTNDLSDLRLESEESILQRLDGLVKEIQASEVILILSFVVCTMDIEINRRVQNYNKLLFDYCAKNLIIFIKHDNINFDHIMRDGIHLNMNGSDILCNNIVQMIDYAIPLCFRK